MAKMNTTEKNDRKVYMQRFTAEGGLIFSYPDMRITVAIVPCLRNAKRSRFAHVSIAQCSHADKFKRKRGELITLERMANGYLFAVPMDGRELWEVADSVAEFLGN